MYPIGSVYLSINNTNPSIYFGGTWELLSAGYVLKTITSGNGGVASNASTTGPSSGTTEPTKLTAAQSGLPKHAHNMTIGGTASGGSSMPYCGTGTHYNAATLDQGPWDASESHTHGLNNHTHTTGMPANISVYAWKRTA